MRRCHLHGECKANLQAAGLFGHWCWEFWGFSWGVLAPVAWWLGAAELRDIKAGLAPRSGQNLATVGMVLGIIGTIFLAVICCLFVCIAIGAGFWLKPLLEEITKMASP